VVFDLETTGLDPQHGDRVVQLAAVRVRAGQVQRDDCFETLVHPGRAIPAAATRVHGIDDARVAGAPPLAQVLPAFLDFVGDGVPAAHHAAFDLAFLNPALRALGRPPLDPAAVVDTLRLSQALFPSWGDYSLEALAARFSLPLHGRHTALGDALLAAEVLVRLLDALALRGVDGLAALLCFQRSRPWERALASVRMHVLHHEAALSDR
jgi:DNA polymerase-3 subunit epsilon